MTEVLLATILAEELGMVGALPEPSSRRRSRKTVFAPDLPGFGVRHFASGRASYIVQTRIGGRMQTLTLGNTAVLTKRQARGVAARVLLRIQNNENPIEQRKRVRAAPLWPRFVVEYWGRVALGWKPSTLVAHDTYRRLHLDRAFPGRCIDEIDEADVTRWFVETTARGGPGGANRTMEILSAMMNKAEAWGYRPDNSNPCGIVRRNRRRKCERFLSDVEFARLGRALDDEQEAEPQRVAAIRLILLTGCRKSEIVGLRWSEVRGRRLVLEDAKTGPRSVWLGDAARAVLDGLPRRRGEKHVFALDTANIGHWLSAFWYRVRDAAGLPRLRVHDLRHSFASKAVRNSENLPMVGKLLGHASIATTARYAHLDDHSLTVAAERIGELIAAALGDAPAAAETIGSDEHLCRGVERPLGRG